MYAYCWINNAEFYIQQFYLIEVKLICMQSNGSRSTRGEAQAGLGLTVPLRQWQVNRHFTRVYTVIYSLFFAIERAFELANSAFTLM